MDDAVWTAVTYWYRAEVLEQNGLLFIRVFISEILDEGRYNLMFVFEWYQTNIVNIRSGQPYFIAWKKYDEDVVSSYHSSLKQTTTFDSNTYLFAFWFTINTNEDLQNYLKYCKEKFPQRLIIVGSTGAHSSTVKVLRSSGISVEPWNQTC